MRYRSVVTLALAAALAGVATPTSLRAQTFLFGTMNGTGDLGTSETFNLGVWGSIFATASSGYDLWAKNGGYGETGLGLCKTSSITTHNGVKSCNETGNTDTEIGNSAGYIRLALTVNAPFPPEWFELSSVQPGESYGFRVGTNVNCGNLGSQTTGTGPNDGNPAVIGAQSGGDSHDPFAYRALAATVRCVEIDPIWSQFNGGEEEGGSQSGGDFLLYSLTMDPPAESVTPEPATMTLMATGLIGMAGAARRRRKK